MSYFKRVGSATSSFINVLVLNGHPNESISARAWRENRVGWVSFIETIAKPGHCQRSYESDVEWAKLIVEDKNAV